MERKSKYHYTEGQQQINRALKMQETELQQGAQDTTELQTQLDSVASSIDDTTSKIVDLDQRVARLQEKVRSKAQEKGLHIASSDSSVDTKSYENYLDKSPLMTDERISISDIPSWADVMKKTDEIVPTDVILEDLLSEEEFQFCQDEVKRINDEFSKKTGLNKVDITFLITATALQTARWILIQHFMGDLGDKIDSSTRSKTQGDEDKKSYLNQYGQNNKKDNVNSDKYPTRNNIIFGQYKRIDGGYTDRWRCPYDAQDNAPEGFGSRGDHRMHTLGHDPILGWIFGTANIMTCTISLSKKFAFATHRVVYPGACFGDRILMAQMFYEVYESIKEDKFRLPAALVAQYAHLKSDELTPNGLPVPLLEALTTDLAGKLYNEQYDALCLLRDIKIVGAQAVSSIIINMIISLVHGLFYNPDKDGRRDFYEVRTRKILLFSNAIATSINLAYVGVNAYTGNVGEALKKLDVGGLLVTLWRLFSDVRFITRVKKQFIQEEMDKVTKESLEQLNSYFE